MEIYNEVVNIIDIELDALQSVKQALLGQIEPVIQAVFECKGKVVLCGIGKSGHIARKVSATMSSVGIPSYFLHPAEGLHGDLGTLSSDDIIIMYSNSGSTTELCNLLPNIRMIGTKIIGITSGEKSPLAEFSNLKIILPIFREAGNLELAPTSSTTAELVVGDAIALTVSKMLNFKQENFALYHPSGALGKKLLTKVKDVMHIGNENPILPIGSSLSAAISEVSEKGLGAVSIIDNNGKLCGIITDGDIRRSMQKKIDVYHASVEQVMTANPVTVMPNMLAVDALRLMENREHQISVLPVTDDNKPIGIVRVHDIIKRNIFM